MTRIAFLISMTVLIGLVAAAVFVGCVAQTPDPAGGSDTSDTTPGGETDVLAGVLHIVAFTESLEDAAKYAADPNDPPDDVDVNLTPTEYTVAFKRIVLKEVDEASEETLAEVELFAAETVDDALVVDLLNSTALDVLDVEDLSAGTYNQVDIEVFYLDMTVATLYPGTTSYDIAYRMVFEEMGVLEPRDFLLYLEPAWMEDAPELAASVTEAGWYWMEMSDPNHVVAVDGAAAHPEFHVLDLFANDEFWSSEHKVLEGGRIEPPLEYDPNDGGVLTIEFDVTGKFNFKDYYDENTEPDGLWEIRRDSGIHPFPPDFNCVPEDVEDAAVAAD
jgi:hypothetical protein